MIRWTFHRRGPYSIFPIMYRLLYLHADEDQHYLRSLEKHLAPLIQLGFIEGWHSGKIQAGQAVRAELEYQISRAQIILVLLSPDLIASPEWWKILLPQALNARDERQAILVPILVRPIDLETSGLAALSPLPTNRLPITRWKDDDEAWLDVIRGIKQLLKSRSYDPTSETITNIDIIALSLSLSLSLSDSEVGFFKRIISIFNKKQNHYKLTERNHQIAMDFNMDFGAINWPDFRKYNDQRFKKIFVTSLPLSDNWFSHAESNVAIITTHDWVEHYRPPNLDAYLLTEIAMCIFHFSSNANESIINPHREDIGCLFDLMLKKQISNGR